MTIPLLACTPLVAALLWAAALGMDSGPFAPGSVLLIVMGLLGLATVGMVGVTVTGGRWSHRTLLVAVAAMLVLAVVRPIDVLWIVAVIGTVLSGIALFSPALIVGLRKLPAASGPPVRAVVLPLLLIGLPFPLGIAAWNEASVGTVVVGLTAPLAALWFARVFPGGLLVVRIIWPALAIGLSLTQWLAPAIVSVASGIAVAVLAWHSSVGVAFHPPREVGTVHPIPPELTPREVLDSADIDEHGRPAR
ncbi:MAG: hypothetical protein ACRDXF_06465 [Acidimicrobiia bacterium]